MTKRTLSRFVATGSASFALLLAIFSGGREAALADEGGVSFWLPGIYGSLAAAPQQPGWSLPLIYYHTSVSASGSIAAAKEVPVSGLSQTLKVNLDLNVNADVDL